MSAGDATVVQGSNPKLDDAFQRLLLRFFAAAAQGTSSHALIRLFCQATREFFQVYGAYFWQRASSDELVGAEADGLMADDDLKNLHHNPQFQEIVAGLRRPPTGVKTP